VNIELQGISSRNYMFDYKHSLFRSNN